MTVTVDLAEAEARLSALVDQAAAGEEIVLSKAGRPLARLVPPAERLPRQPGVRRDWQIPDELFLEPPDEGRGRGGHGCARRQPTPVKLLLDTHALIWWLTDSARRSAAAREAIAEPETLILASAASGYEIANKERLGRLAAGIAEDLPRALRRARILVHPLTQAHHRRRRTARAAPRPLGSTEHGAGAGGRARHRHPGPGVPGPRPRGGMVRRTTPA